jgi:hypothetical protein
MVNYSVAHFIELMARSVMVARYWLIDTHRNHKSTARLIAQEDER